MISYTSTSATTNASTRALPNKHSLRNEYIRAVIKTVPLALNVLAYGLAYGALANNTNHLTLFQTLTMSIFVFAGPAQFSILSLLQQNGVLWALVLSTFFINARYILYGLTLGRNMRHIPKRHIAWLSHGLTDETYSMAMVQVKNGKVSATYFAGAATPIILAWLLSSVIGYGLGGLIRDPAQFGLDFVFIGAFIGLLVTQLKQRRHVLAACFAIVASTFGYYWFGTTGAVFAGAIAAFLVGVSSK